MSWLQAACRAAWGLGFLVACSCEANVQSDPQASTAPVESSTAPLTATAAEQGAAGEPALSGEELDRLLDALEQEIAAESRKL